MENIIRDGKQFAILFDGFLKARDVLYGVNSSMFLDRSQQYKDYLWSFNTFVEKASNEDGNVIESTLKISLDEIRKVIEKEFDILQFEDQEKNGDFDEI